MSHDPAHWTHVLTGSPWPLRKAGMRCRVVRDPNEFSEKHSTYPWAGLGRDEVVVLIENDPYDSHGEFSSSDALQGWSCVLATKWIAEARSEPEATP